MLIKKLYDFLNLLRKFGPSCFIGASFQAIHDALQHPLLKLAGSIELLNLFFQLKQEILRANL